MTTAALSIREDAAERFRSLGYPTPRMEEWKYTNVAPIAKVSWSAGRPRAASAAETAAAPAATLTFLNGRIVQKNETRGLRILPISEAAQSDLEPYYGRIADWQRNAFVALNIANSEDGALIIADGVVDGFVHLVFIGEGDDVWSHPHNIIVANRVAQLTVVETYLGRGKHFTNTVTEIFAGPGAVVDHYKIVREPDEAFHVGSVQIRQDRSSSVTSHNACLGGGLVRNDINVSLAGEGASLTLDGLFVVTGNQHVDNHTLIDHIAPHCESHELYKGILDDSARGVFDGRIIVRPGAQKTVSRQENRNLLLSETAIVDSKPTLEIHNDDVKCNHGSTIGQLEEEPLFYLRSRGIGEAEARNLLVLAFASQIVDRMKVEPVREEVRRVLFERMPGRMTERREAKR
ncbi:MAG TPA: Fe-S cluster assembly protein SufD [Thermoanaerobaculia bacterium]|nr:Fe-S cluster assembly protein SufD [Thermoanaerobaculia bacterium]